VIAATLTATYLALLDEYATQLESLDVERSHV
jgi:hypothetical protein